MKCTLNYSTHTVKVFCRNSLLWLLALMCCLIPLRVSASPNDGLTDLTINYVDDEKPIEDAPFSLYLVAMVHDDGSIELTDEFSEAQINGNTLDYIVEDEDEVTDNSLFGLAETFESYILVEEAEGKTIKPVAEGETDSNGELDFASLTQGIYLLTGDTHEVDEQLYIPTASLITLPYVYTNGNVDYSPSVLPKYEVRTHSTPGSDPLTTEMHVQKIWEDNSSTARPAEVDVMLFKDGEKYDEVKLNEENSWYHTWKNLDKDSRWQLGEVSVPNGYTVLTELEGSTFVVVNTLETTTPTPTPTTTSTPHYPHGGRPKTPSTPSETPTEVVTLTESPVEGTTKTPSDNDDGLPPFTTEIVSDESPETPTDSELVTVGNPPIEDLPNTPTAKTKLPQTGQLWWPVPLLAFGGLIAYVAGRRLKTDVNASSKTDVDSDDEK